MNAVNLFMLTRNKDMNICSEYENVISQRKKKQKVKEHEYKSLCALVDLLLENGIPLSSLEGFHFSYRISQISKEFDLLKVKKDERVVNIELKSCMISENEIEKQLIRNKYYLRLITDEISLFTYVADVNRLYTLHEDKIIMSEIGDVIKVLEAFEGYEESLDTLFNAKDYLISPLNNSIKFLGRNYFLTDAQEKIKRDVLLDIKNERDIVFWGITGSAGTGKTLLLYDLARDLAEIGSVCIIHCGVLCEGHTFLDSNINNLDIIQAKVLNNNRLDSFLESCDFILIDETQRIYESSYHKIINIIKENDLTGIFSYDSFQTLAKSEEENNIVQKLNSLEGFREKN